MENASFKIEQDLDTIFKCYLLDSSLKILPCDFFLMGWNFFFFS